MTADYIMAECVHRIELDEHSHIAFDLGYLRADGYGKSGLGISVREYRATNPRTSTRYPAARGFFCPEDRITDLLEKVKALEVSEHIRGLVKMVLMHHVLPRYVVFALELREQFDLAGMVYGAPKGATHTEAK